MHAIFFVVAGCSLPGILSIQPDGQLEAAYEQYFSVGHQGKIRWNSNLF
jgi:hypothetical protein